MMGNKEIKISMKSLKKEIIRKNQNLSLVSWLQKINLIKKYKLLIFMGPLPAIILTV